MSFQVDPILQDSRAAIWVITIRNRAEVWVKSEKSLTESDLSEPALSLTKELHPLHHLSGHTEQSNYTGRQALGQSP